MLSEELEQLRTDLASLSAAGQYCSLFTIDDEENLNMDCLRQELSLIEKSSEQMALHARSYLRKVEGREEKKISDLKGFISKSNDLIRIRIDGRIRRRQQSVRGESPGTGYEKYVKSVFDLLSELGSGEYKRYREKVQISFIQHYASTQSMLDADNMEVKPFIDAICLYLLDDDSPEHCFLVLDGIVDGSDWLEITIQPTKKNI